MILCHEHKFVFLKGRKVAGTSVEIALSRICGPEDVITPITPADERLRLDVGRACQNFCDDRDLVQRYVELVCDGQFREALKTGVHNPKIARFVNHTTLREVEELTHLPTEEYTRIFCERNPYAKVISLANMKLSFAVYDGGPMVSDAHSVIEKANEIVESGEHERLRNIPLYETDRLYARSVCLLQETLKADFARLRELISPALPSELPFVKQGSVLLDLHPSDVFTARSLRIINDHFADEFERYGYERLPA